VPNDPALAHWSGSTMFDDGSMMDARAGVFGDVHGTAADDCTATCASAEFRQSHLYRHYIASQFHVALVDTTCDPVKSPCRVWRRVQPN
jgi:hypothetical protein